MSSRNGSEGSGNQGSPKTNQSIEHDSSIGNDNKGKEYRSRQGSQSKEKHRQ